MTVIFRCRVDKSVLKKANAVTQQLGTNTGEIFRMFLTEIARTGKVPLKLALKLGETAMVPWEQRAQALENFYDESKTSEGTQSN